MKAFMTPGDFTASTTVTFTNIVVDYAEGAPVAMDFEPGALNLNANGNSVTVLLEPQAPYAAADIDIGSLRLNGQVLPSAGFAPQLGDDNGNGIMDLKLKFSRMAASNAIAGSGLATVTGEVGGRCFEASDPVRIVPVHSPAGGASIAGGQVVDVRWSTPPGVSASTVDIYYSSSGGEAWALEAQGVPNTGSYAWTAPGNSTYRGRVAVVMNNVAGFSGEFSINGTVGVGDPGAVAFALKGVTPNPAKSDMNVQFSLPDGKRATLSLFDVSGRRVASRDVGSLGAGRHTVNLAKQLPAGLYLVRLDREGASLTARAAVVR
jgi:hypothetical protein